MSKHVGDRWFDCTVYMSIIELKLDSITLVQWCWSNSEAQKALGHPCQAQDPAMRVRGCCTTDLGFAPHARARVETAAQQQDAIPVVHQRIVRGHLQGLFVHTLGLNK